jgi:dienelactone hydrolase
MIGMLIAMAAFSAVDDAGAMALRVLDPASEPALMMTKYLNRLADEAIRKRNAEREALKTPDNIALYQEQMRRYFFDQLHLPEKTPLNARVVGAGAKPTFHYEKIIFESRPRFYVTGIMFLPMTPPPYPAVLVPCGHGSEGKVMDSYERVCIGLAQSGIAAFIYDPIGQGERSQILSEEGKPVYESTIEHMFCGAGGILLGGGTAAYRIWDGIRAIDYLMERPDVNHDLIGCTGNSGGGTLTSYLMALDNRIVCAAPSCYITSLKRLLQTAGPQDAEQNIHGQIAAGLDHSDYIMMRAPKPTLICCATGDFFDISGTWDSFRQAKRLYTKLNAADRLQIAEADEKHGFSLPLRQAAVQWMRSFLLNDGNTYVEVNTDPLTAEETQCTPKGQVLLLDGARSLYDIDAETEHAFKKARRQFLANSDKIAVRQKIRDLAGIRAAEQIVIPGYNPGETIQREGYTVQKLVLSPEPGIQLPALAFAPPEPGADIVLYCGTAMAADAVPGGALEKMMMERKCMVFAVDLRGLGETESVSKHKTYNDNFGGGWQDFFRAYMLNKTYVGMRAEDIFSCVKYLQSSGVNGEKKIHLFASGDAGPAAMHAAALEPQLFTSVSINSSIKTWTECVKRPISPSPLIHTVYGALQYYDLPDLIRLH